MKKPVIAVFASGNGSNAMKIIEHFEKNETAQVLILSNNPKAEIIEKAKTKGINPYIFDRTTFYQTEEVLAFLRSQNVDYIVLAGFLWLFPSYLVTHFPNKILNIHPALLPHYGGKGMYGMNVHKAVIDAKEKESGITIHLVNEHYDEGQIIFQARCSVEPTDTPQTLAQKIHTLEHQHFAPVIESFFKISVPSL